MSFFKLLLIAFIAFVQLAFTTYAESNLIYIVMEGTSRSSLYSLIQKNKLNNIMSIIKQGNYRNLEIEGMENDYEELYLTMLTGHDRHEFEISSQNFSSQISFFEQIKTKKLNYNTTVLFTPNDDVNQTSVVYNLISELVNHNKPYSRIKHSSSYELGVEAAAVIKAVKKPFVIFLNFTNIDKVGQRYREGGELYSQAIFNCDRAIGIILNQLKKQQLLDETNIFITTNYGMEPKSKFKSHLTWVISNKKTQRKGVIQDIVPSLYDLIGIKPNRNQYFGESIFK